MDTRRRETRHDKNHSSKQCGPPPHRSTGWGLGKVGGALWICGGAFNDTPPPPGKPAPEKLLFSQHWAGCLILGLGRESAWERAFRRDSRASGSNDSPPPLWQGRFQRPKKNPRFFVIALVFKNKKTLLVITKKAISLKKSLIQHLCLGVHIIYFGNFNENFPLYCGFYASHAH